jgi:hypothetical protein
LDRHGLEHFRKRVEQVLNRLTHEAEAWAESRTRKLGEHPIHRGPARFSTRRIDPAHVAPTAKGRRQQTAVSRADR